MHMMKSQDQHTKHVRKLNFAKDLILRYFGMFCIKIFELSFIFEEINLFSSIFNDIRMFLGSFLNIVCKTAFLSIISPDINSRVPEDTKLKLHY